MNLSWKEFQVNLARMHKILKQDLENYDGMIADENILTIIFYETPSQGDIDYVTDYWASLTQIGELTPTPDEQLVYVENLVKNAIKFGQGLIINFAAKNVLEGITLAGKTREVATYLANIQVLLNSGSLYGAIDQINDLINEGVPSNLAPYVTEAKLEEYKALIEEYLGV